MKFVDQSFTELTDPVTPFRGVDLLKHVELCGRNAYKSEHIITDDSYKKFIKMIVDKEHYSVIEHGAIYWKFKTTLVNDNPDFEKLLQSPYSKVKKVTTKNNKGNYFYLYTNLRVLAENAKEVFNKYVTDLVLPEGVVEFTPGIHDPYRRHTVRLITDRGIMGELTRHRPVSFTIESTRYVNYNKRGGIEYLNTKKYFANGKSWFLFKVSCKISEILYKLMIKFGEKPQMARNVLNHGTKTDIIMSGFACDFTHIINLRSSKAAHPVIRPIANYLEWII